MNLARIKKLCTIKFYEEYGTIILVDAVCCFVQVNVEYTCTFETSSHFHVYLSKDQQTICLFQRTSVFLILLSVYVDWIILTGLRYITIHTLDYYSLRAFLSSHLRFLPTFLSKCQ